MLVKPAPWEEVAHRLRGFSGGLSRLCEALLLDMGASPRWVGLPQAAFCAGGLGERRYTLLKEAYGDLAIRDRCTTESIEKSIRDVVNRLWRKDSPLYREIYGEERPSNGDFLRKLADYALLGPKT